MRVYTDHKNLTYKTQNIERLIHWRLLIEEFTVAPIVIAYLNPVVLLRTISSLKSHNADSS